MTGRGPYNPRVVFIGSPGSSVGARVGTAHTGRDSNSNSRNKFVRIIKSSTATAEINSLGKLNLQQQQQK